MCIVVGEYYFTTTFTVCRKVLLTNLCELANWALASLTGSHVNGLVCSQTIDISLRMPLPMHLYGDTVIFFYFFIE